MLVHWTNMVLPFFVTHDRNHRGDKMIDLIGLLKKIGRILGRCSFLDLFFLFVVNIIFSCNYLFSPSYRMIGFPIRQDGYLHMIVIDHILGLAQEGSIPFGVTWFDVIRNGAPRLIFVGPTYLVYVSLFGMTGDYILSWKLTVFLFYLLGSVAVYFLAKTLAKNSVIPIVSAVSYAFFQPTVFALSLGHIGEVSSFAMLPVVLLFYVKGIRKSSNLFVLLSAIVLSMMIIERPDYGYIGIALIAFFAIFFLLTKAEKLRTFVHTSFFYAIAFLISFPFVYFGYLSRFSELIQQHQTYGYVHYSPKLSQIVTPSFGTVEAYLGISVLILSAIGAYALVRTWVERRKQRVQVDEKTRMLLFLFILALVFLLVGLGANTPLYGLLCDYVPYFKSIRAPTRWLAVAQLCLSILAGYGAFLLIKSLFKKEKVRILRHEVKSDHFRTLMTTIVAIIIFTDVSTYVSSPEEGWHPVGHLESGEGIYVFPQTAQIPADTEVYRRIAEDESEFRVLSVPFVYSLPYHQYLRYLSGSKVRMTHGYALTIPAGLQGEVYENVRYGNITDDFGEKLALLGGKYAIYDYYYSEWPALLKKMNSSQDLQFVLEDNGYFLYRNNRFGNSHMEENLVINGGFEEGEEDWLSWHRENGTTEVDTSTSRSGNWSMKSVSKDIRDLAGRVLVLNGSALESREFILSGWSKCENVSGENPLYAIRANTVYFGDGEDIVSTGAYAVFSPGTHDWEFSSATFSVNTTMTIKSIKISLFLRNATGTAWFDDIYLNGERLLEDWAGAFLVREPYEDPEALLSQGNKVDAIFKMEKEKANRYRIELRTNESTYVILGTSYDEGWRLFTEDSTRPISLLEYKGLMMFFIEEPGLYDIIMKFIAYEESLGTIGLSCGGAVLVAAVFLAYPRLIPYVMKMYHRIATRTRNRRGRSRRSRK